MAEYERMKLSNELSPALARPTPAGLRRECETVIKERHERRDDATLRDFFGAADTRRQYLELIENFSVDRFRPLVKYLNRATGNTDDKNIELLAWLINFRHRPHKFQMDVLLTDEEREILKKKEVQGAAGPSEDNGFLNQEADGDSTARPLVEKIVAQVKASAEIKQPKTRFLNLTLILLIIVLSLGTIAIYQSRHNGQRAQSLAAFQGIKCMYWDEDHYEPIPCNAKIPDRLILPLDQNKIKGFKRIMRVDTISEYCIGKIYYISIDGKKEYYTSGGNHPIDNTRHLRVLSRRIWENHLKNNYTPQQFNVKN